MAEQDSWPTQIVAQSNDGGTSGADKRQQSDRRDLDNNRRADERRECEERRQIELDLAEADVPGPEERRDPNRPVQEQRLAGIGEVIPDRRQGGRREDSRRTRPRRDKK